MGHAFFLLTCFHLLFFRRFYFQNPYCYARGELLEQGFASSRLLGRALRRGRFPLVDECYYPNARGLPFLSGCYPPHLVQAWLGSFLSLNQAWLLFCFTMVSHFWLASGSVYILATAMGLAPWPAGLASLTLSYGAYAVKPNASIIYTTAWIPTLILAGMLKAPWLFGISLGMMLLAGYWPLALPATVVGGFGWLMR